MIALDTDAYKWSATDLKAALQWKRYDLLFIAGHFSASETEAADKSIMPTADLLASPVNMTNTLVLSPGCHSGYNIVTEDAIPWTQAPDWASAFARKGVTVVGGTGFQYGDDTLLEYSDRLYVDIVRQLRYGTGPVAIGDAILAAKQAYLASTPSMGPVHQKSLLVTTLYGLPSFSVNFPYGREPAPTLPNIVGPVTPVTDVPGATFGLHIADATADFSLTRNTIAVQTTEGENVSAIYLSGTQGTMINPGEPALPLEVRDVSMQGQLLRGVGFWGGTYAETEGVRPLIGALATEVGSRMPPFFAAAQYPQQPWIANYFDKLVDPQSGETRLLMMPAQYRWPDPTSAKATERKFSSMAFRLFYLPHPSTAPVPNATRPVIFDVTGAEVTGAEVTGAETNGTVAFKAHLAADRVAGVQQVWATYTASGGSNAGKWQSVYLAQDRTDLSLWQASVPLPADERGRRHPVHGSSRERRGAGRAGRQPGGVLQARSSAGGAGLHTAHHRANRHFWDLWLACHFQGDPERRAGCRTGRAARDGRPARSANDSCYRH